MLEVTRFRTIEEELDAPTFEDFSAELYDSDSPAPWYLAVRVVEEFRYKFSRYPGDNYQDKEKDYVELKDLADKLLAHIVPDGSITLSEKYLKELLRFGDSKLHTVAAFLGGVASQEAIKLIIKQYTPLNHTLLYDGIHGKTLSLQV